MELESPVKEGAQVSLSSALEAILFAAGAPVSLSDLATACDVDEASALTALSQLAESYTARDSGLSVQKLGDCWQMCTTPRTAPYVRTALDKRKAAPLSNAAMEVLTIVAYHQPVSKGYIERVRGVDSSSVVNTLVDKELLAEDGRLDVPGHPIAYVTTPHFLRCFSLSSLDDLPPLPDASQVATNQVIVDADA